MRGCLPCIRGEEIASYTVRWRQRGTLTWNTVVQSPVDPDDPDILIGTDLLPEDETYEILLSMAFVSSTTAVVVSWLMPCWFMWTI